MNLPAHQSQRKILVLCNLDSSESLGVLGVFVDTPSCRALNTDIRSGGYSCANAAEYLLRTVVRRILPK